MNKKTKKQNKSLLHERSPKENYQPFGPKDSLYINQSQIERRVVKN